MPDSTHSPSPDLGAEGTAYVTVGAGSRAQVAFLRQDEVRLGLRTIRDATIELVGPAFYPKGCELELTLSVPGGATVRGLAGIVRKVQMIGAEPRYEIGVQLESASAATLAAHQPAWSAGRESGGRVDTSGAGTGPVPRWASLLVWEGLITEAELRAVVDDASKRGGLEEALLASGVVSPESVAICMAMDMSVAYVEPRSYHIRLANRDLVPEELARRHGLFPLFQSGGVITLGMDDPTDLALIDRVRLTAKSQVDPCICPPGALETLIEAAYRQDVPPPPTADTPQPIASEGDEAGEESEEPPAGSAIVQLVHSMLSESARSGASDVHIEPEKNHVRVRVRVDGILHETATHALPLHVSIVSRIKVMARLDISETRRPQDGHFSITVDRRLVDVRVSTIPTVYGENVVMRLLLSSAEAMQLEGLGMPADVLARVRHFLAQPNGMVLATGPTGSGKTTTLYAALERLNTVQSNLVTVEDPVEKRVPLLRQTEVNLKAGVTFATGLRSLLRQDPDVIMVGEIRDTETAEIAVQAALTGHLVLSTLHTNTAAGAIVRLAEMGVTPFLITSALRAVISQRLVRRICKSCAREVDPDPRLVIGLGIEDVASTRFMAGSGCVHCLQTGYKGRVGIYEVLEITGGLSRVILGGAPREEIEHEAQAALGAGLREDGLNKVREGKTTVEEIARIVGVTESGLIDGGA